MLQRLNHHLSICLAPHLNVAGLSIISLSLYHHLVLKIAVGVLTSLNCHVYHRR